MKTLMMTLALALVSTAACKKNNNDTSATGAPKVTEGDKTPSNTTVPANTTPTTTTPTTTTPTTPSAGATAAANMPTECVDYKAAFDKLATCDKIDAATRQQLKQTYDTQSATWANLQDDAKGDAAASCKAALDAINAAAKTPCGW